MYDLIIKNGCILDGTGEPEYTADIGIKGDKIQKIGHDLSESKKTINAEGRYVCPGFIDTHGHSDFSVLEDPTFKSKIAQGITTEIMGNCGFSAYPFSKQNDNLLYTSYNKDLFIEGPKDYFRLLENGIGINIVSFSGLSSIYQYAGEDIEKIINLINEYLSGNSRGLSIGMPYLNLDVNINLLNLIKKVKELKLVTFHLSSYGENIESSLNQMMELCKETKIIGIASHMCVYGEENWGKGRKIKEMFEEFRQKGAEVYYDILAYPTFGAWWAPRAIFPTKYYNWEKPWQHNLNSLKSILKNKNNWPEIKRIIEERRKSKRKTIEERLLIFNSWENIYLFKVANTSSFSKYKGKSIKEISQKIGKESVEVFFELLLKDDGKNEYINLPVSQEDYLVFLKDPKAMFGTDSLATSKENEKELNLLQLHPRHFNTFPYILSEYVSNQKIISLSTAINRATYLPAKVFNLPGRGLIKEGCFADITIFSFDRIAENSISFLESNSYPSGIDAVLINGKISYYDNEFVGELNGKIL